MLDTTFDSRLLTPCHPMAHILLVEDNAADVRLTVEALKEANVRTHLHVTRDGEEASDFLYRRGAYRQSPRPDLILLDLNLPRKDGRALLAEVKQDPDLRRIPVVVLTTSQAEQDVRASYDLHVNCYIPKPVDMEQFIEVVKAIDGFWLGIVTLPERSGLHDGRDRSADRPSR